jgi:hypothetical protein
MVFGRRSRSVAWLCAAAGLAACGGGGGGGGNLTPVAPSGHPQLERLEYGRLADVYGLQTSVVGTTTITTPVLYQKDVLIGPDIRDERQPGDDLRDDQILYDFTTADPDTLQIRLFITRDIASEQFLQAFNRLDDEVRSVTPLAFGQGGVSRPYSVVPRNAAIRLKFSAALGIDDSFFVERASNGLVTGMGLPFVADDSIGREGVNQSLAIVALVRVEISPDR